MREKQFRVRLIQRLRKDFPGCIIVKPDPSQIQGIPDVLILYKNMWAALELKVEEKSAHQPNQDYWVQYMNGLSFASFIDIDSEEDVLYELQLAFRSARASRVPQSV